MIENTEKTFLIKKQMMNKIQRIVKELMDMYDYRYGDEQEWNQVQTPDEVELDIINLVIDLFEFVKLEDDR